MKSGQQTAQEGGSLHFRKGMLFAAPLTPLDKGVFQK